MKRYYLLILVLTFITSVKAQDATWNGTSSTDWNDGLNWSPAVPPVAGQTVKILSGTTYSPVIVTGTVIILDLTIDTGAVLSVGSAANLHITRNLINNGSLLVDAYAVNSGDLIVDGVASGTGTISYSNTVYPEFYSIRWNLMSSPVTGEQYNDAWITANSIASGTGNNRGISTYNNTTDANGSWDYFTAGSTTATFVNGRGYGISRSTDGKVTFTGTYTVAPVTATITQSGTNYWNLVGNPFIAHINIVDFITENTTKLSAANQAVYVWNASASEYQAKTTGYLRPGQGFFINANVISGTVSFTKAMQSSQSSSTFYRTADNNFKIEILLVDGNNIRTTEINYLENKTTSLDPGFDIGTFTGTNTSFSLYTQLVSDNEGVNLMRQALPDSNYENMVVPIGVNATAGTELTFTADAMNIPTGYMVFLEDRDAGVFTRLDEANSEYKVTLTADSNNIGRFYLHTPTEVLNVNNTALENISVFTINKTTLRMVGLPQGDANVTLFSLLGKQVMQTSFNTNGVKEISLPTLARGVYVVQLATAQGKLTKKIIIE